MDQGGDSVNLCKMVCTECEKVVRMVQWGCVGN